jgi:NAD(P)-dependent dehydrogenase (short-subunit alcohol dehydrogenase family)
MGTMRLDGKVAIITGSGRGIGRALAERFAAEGARVVIAARTQGEIKHVAKTIQSSGGTALPIACDVSDEAQVKNLIRQTLGQFERIDILVNNAGIGLMRPVWGIPLSGFERTLAVNLVGAFLCIKHVWRPMRDLGGGSIINVSSLGGLRGYPLLAAYCASKWGLIGLTKSCAEEGKAEGIRVNAIAPGKGDTAFRAQIREDKSQMLKPEDHVAVCLFLASDESRFITGEVISLEWFGRNGMAH